MPIIKMQMPDESPKGRRRMANAKGFKTSEVKNDNITNNFTAGQKYASSARAPSPSLDNYFIKLAQWGGGGNGANVTITPPGFFSPMHTPQNWQIASKRKEIYQWARFYYENEPKVAAGVDFYAQFPLNGFTLECKNRKIRAYFEDLVSTLKLNYWLRLISHEYFLLGDVFPFLEIECKHCNGSGVNKHGKPCNHPDGRFKSLIVLNPDFVEVEDSPFPDKRALKLIPDDNLKRTVLTQEPKHVYERIPDSIKAMVASGQPIPLSHRSASHIKHSECPYGKYGTSMLRRLFTVLAYKTKLMTANWIVAERLILPVRVVKIGEKDRPAGPDDIADMQNQLAAVASDPNLTIVTHHAFDYEWYGACLDTNSEILTTHGWKRWDEVDRKNEVVATYNKETGNMEFQPIQDFYEYDFQSTDTLKMYHFNARSVDVMVTPNHRMLVRRNGELHTIYSQDVKHGDEFISSVGWQGTVPERLPFRDSPLGHLSLDDYLKLIGYYISEGGCKIERNKGLSEEYEVQAVGISQSINSECYGSIKNIVQLASCGKYHVHKDERREVSCHTFNMSATIARHLAETCGQNSGNKCIPHWVKNLPVDKLRILYNAMMEGDGSIRMDRRQPRYKYTTVSKDLSDGFSELLLKLGYFPTTSVEKASNTNSRDIFRLHWSDRRKETPLEIRQRHIHREEYNGKVWCVKVPNSYIITRRNGKITVQGNSGKIHNIQGEWELIGKEILDGMMLNQALLNGEMGGYSSAQIGVETLIRRLDGWRARLAEWVEEHIFKPTAMMQGFIDEEATKQLGKTKYLYPTIKWSDMQLRDKTNKLQMFMQLHDKSLISTERLLEEFDIDYDQETERLRNQQLMQPMPAQPGAPGAPGGMPMAGAVGAPGGGMPAGGDMGAPPGGPGGAPGASPGGAPMGGAPGGGGGGGGMGASASGQQKIYKKGKAPKKEEEVIPPQIVKLTRIEQKIWKVLQDLKVPFRLYGQFKQQVPGENQPYVMDFALPDIQVDIEADGKIWHEKEGAPERNAERDRKLAAHGWRILRFNEDAINEHMDQVQQVISQNIKEAAEERFSQRKNASSDELTKKAESIVESEEIVNEYFAFDDSGLGQVISGVDNSDDGTIQLEPDENGGS